VEFVSPTERYTNQNQYSFEAGGIRLFGSGNGTAYNLYYTPVIEPLSDDNTTNWLLDNAPDLYLYASALEAAIYIRDTELMQVLSSMTGGLIESVRRLSERKFIPSGSLQIKAR
jgi:hypothetical protein